MKHLTIILSLTLLASCQKELSFERNSGPQLAATYDTTLIDVVNYPRTFTFPTLPGAKLITITKTLSVVYGYTYWNQASALTDFKVYLGRLDQTKAGSATFTESLLYPVGRFVFNPGQKVTIAPQAFISRHKKTDTIPPDGWTGSVTYSPRTYTDHTGSDVYYFQATATDTVRMRVQYFF